MREELERVETGLTNNLAFHYQFIDAASLEALVQSLEQSPLQKLSISSRGTVSTSSIPHRMRVRSTACPAASPFGLDLSADGVLLQ